MGMSVPLELSHRRAATALLPAREESTWIEGWGSVGRPFVRRRLPSPLEAGDFAGCGQRAQRKGWTVRAAVEGAASETAGGSDWRRGRNTEMCHCPRTKGTLKSGSANAASTPLALLRRSVGTDGLLLGQMARPLERDWRIAIEESVGRPPDGRRAPCRHFGGPQRTAPASSHEASA